MFTVNIFITFINITLHSKRDFASMMKVKDPENLILESIGG